MYNRSVEQSPDMPISEFKAKCLGVVDGIATTGTAITLTKRGQPVARVIPIESVTAPLKDTWSGGAVRISGDLVNFDLAADWETAQ
jgi:prevent-host-death family protein